MTSGLLYVVGAGGAGREVAELSRRAGWEAIAFLVESEHRTPGLVAGRDVLSFEDEFEPGSFVVGVGDPDLRRRLASMAVARGLEPVSVVHPSSVCDSDRVDVAAGAVLCAGTILTADIQIGSHAYLNIGASVSHDVTIGDFSVLSPRATVCGHVRIGHGVMVGAGATIINGTAARPLRIGDDAVIAAGACVTRDVEQGSMVAGVPAIRRR
jgi:sugar O-acyltransferase (sialic acid O-acetyltransferase NeuD family)